MACKVILARWRGTLLNWCLKSPAENSSLSPPQQLALKNKIFAVGVMIPPVSSNAVRVEFEGKGYVEVWRRKKWS